MRSRSTGLLSLCALALAAAASAQTPPDRFTAIPEAVRPFVEKGEISGAVMLVADQARVRSLAAVGQSDLATGRTMATNDLFWIASMSKPVTAVAVALLVDDGKLKFDDPVEKYVPEFARPWVKIVESPTRHRLVHAARPLTLRDVLTHTSGLGEYTQTDPHWTLTQMTQSLAQEPLRFQPGERWGYSTAGIDLLGRVVEVASGMPFAEFMQRRIFDPLGMKDTTFWISPEQEKRLAHDYKPSAATGKLEETTIHYLYGGAVTDHARPPLGGAGLFSTAEDMAKFYQMMLNHGQAAGRKILRAATVAELTRKQTRDLPTRPGMPWGLGFCIVEDPSQMGGNTGLSPGTFGHGGAHGTQSWADPSRNFVYILMIQRDALKPNPDDSAMRRAYQAAAAEALGNSPAEKK